MILTFCLRQGTASELNRVDFATVTLRARMAAASTLDASVSNTNGLSKYGCTRTGGDTIAFFMTQNDLSVSSVHKNFFFTDFSDNNGAEISAKRLINRRYYPTNPIKLLISVTFFGS